MRPVAKWLLLIAGGASITFLVSLASAQIQIVGPLIAGIAEEVGKQAVTFVIELWKPNPQKVAYPGPSVAGQGHQPGPRPNSNNQIWESPSCPEGTTVIGGTCTITSGFGYSIQNFSLEPGFNGFSCKWTGPVTSATVTATCLPKPPTPASH
jgi:hypothetical protein